MSTAVPTNERAAVRLDRDGNELRLVIEDDGKGIEPDCITSPTSYGIQGMREHAIQLGGTLRIEGRPTPFGAAIKAREDNGLSSHRQGGKESFVAKR